MTLFCFLVYIYNEYSSGKGTPLTATMKSPPTAAATSVPRRRTVPVARKGGSMMAGRSTPSQGHSPSIVLSGKRASIASVTVAMVSECDFNIRTVEYCV